MTMKQELAALKKKRDAGDITAFKFRQGTREIKNKYGKSAPSNVSKIVNFISKKVGPAMTEISPRSAKAVATKKKAALANRGKSQGGQKAGEARKYATAKKVAKSSKGAFSNLDLNKSKNTKKQDSKSSDKTWRDVKSVSAAIKNDLNYFTGSDGKRKIAITAEQLNKKGMSLREYANSLKGKK